MFREYKQCTLAHCLWYNLHYTDNHPPLYYQVWRNCAQGMLCTLLHHLSRICLAYTSSTMVGCSRLTVAEHCMCRLNSPRNRLTVCLRWKRCISPCHTRYSLLSCFHGDLWSQEKCLFVCQNLYLKGSVLDGGVDSQESLMHMSYLSSPTKGHFYPFSGRGGCGAKETRAHNVLGSRLKNPLGKGKFKTSYS